jgi:nitrogen regulatory protein PII
MPYVYKEVEVEIDLDDFDTDELVEELERRGAGTAEFGDGKEWLTAIYEKRRLGKDYQQELDQLIYLGLGRVC